MDKYTQFLEVIHAMMQNREAKWVVRSALLIAGAYVLAELIRAIAPNGLI